MAKDIDVPILEGVLQITDQVTLGNMTLHPGYKILIRMINTACAAANATVVSTNPEADDYDRILRSRQQRARNWSELSIWLFKSIDWHTKSGSSSQSEEERLVEEL